MSDNIGYVWEKLYLTVLAMAESPYPLEKRLPRAWFDQLSRLNPEDFDGSLSDLKHEFEAIRNMLHQPNAEAVLADMGAEELHVFACSITGLYDKVSALNKQTR